MIEFLEKHIAPPRELYRRCRLRDQYCDSGVLAVATSLVRGGNEKRATSVLRTASSIIRAISKRASAASTSSIRARVSGCAGTNRVQQSWSGIIYVSNVRSLRAWSII